ncbi:MAG: hypothetical protein L6461_16890 [Anaerolineae bacterium]|nr:hypothetical protein [Anaerolineae bacterium]
MRKHRIHLSKLGYLLFIIVFGSAYTIASCSHFAVYPNLITKEAPTKINWTTADVTLTPTPRQTSAAGLPQKDSNLIDLNLLPTGDYIVIRDKADGWKNALYVITPDGNLIGYLAAGYYFNRASISPDHRWLVYDENSQSYLLNLRTGEEIKLDQGCKSPSWAPDGQTLISACRKMLLSYELKNGNWTKTGSLLPDLTDFSQ